MWKCCRVRDCDADWPGWRGVRVTEDLVAVGHRRDFRRRCDRACTGARHADGASIQRKMRDARQLGDGEQIAPAHPTRRKRGH